MAHAWRIYYYVLSCFKNRFSLEDASLKFRVRLATFDRQHGLGMFLSPSIKWVGTILHHLVSCSDGKDSCGIKKKKNLLQITVNHTGTLFLNWHNGHVPAFRTDVFSFQEIRKRQNDSFQRRIPSPGCPFQIGADVSSIRKLLTSIWLLKINSTGWLNVLEHQENIPLHLPTAKASFKTI